MVATPTRPATSYQLIRRPPVASAHRLAAADALEPGFDAGEASLDERLELGVGEDVGPVPLDPLAHQLADVERIDPGLDALADRAQPRRHRPAARARREG